MKRDQLIEEIREAIHEIEPESEIILYGSRARRDALSDSDWDFLILVDGSASDERTDRIRHKLYEIEWESGEVISSIVRNRKNGTATSIRRCHFTRESKRKGLSCDRMEQGSGAVPYDPGKRNAGRCSYSCQCRAVECMREPSLLCLLLCRLGSSCISGPVIIQAYGGAKPCGSRRGVIPNRVQMVTGEPLRESLQAFGLLPPG